MARPIPETHLRRWQQTDAVRVLPLIAQYAKEHAEYRLGTTRPDSSCWHVVVNGREFDLICTGPRFWDCHLRTGGGGAVDLVMHLTNTSFRSAAGILRDVGL